LLAFALLAILAGVSASAVQEVLPRPTGKVTPKLEAVAETKLLMEGLAHANFRGMEKLLRQKPGDVQTWTFLRGQALLIAETGNLLLLRPPRNQGQSVWMERASDLRAQAVKLARAAAREDYAGCKTGLRDLATACNRCHNGFQVQVRIVPFEEPVNKAEVRSPEGAVVNSQGRQPLDRTSPR
jgi:hypothetical protein